jgi:hypothetical protein
VYAVYSNPKKQYAFLFPSNKQATIINLFIDNRVTVDKEHIHQSITEVCRHTNMLGSCAEIRHQLFM